MQSSEGDVSASAATSASPSPSPPDVKGLETTQDGLTDGEVVGTECGAERRVESEILLDVRWGTQKVELSLSPTDFETFCVLDLRRKIEEELNIPHDRQKFLGLTSKGRLTLLDTDMLHEVEFKKARSFVLVGTTRDRAFIDPSMRDDLPEIIDDFIYDPSSRFDIRTDTHLLRLKRAMTNTEFRIIRQPRHLKPLLVLDLDYTLLDCKGGGLSIEELKRPHLNTFLQVAYQHFDLVVWSQTQWKWVEMKCTELGLLTSTAYGICFALDRSSMFTVCVRRKDGSERSHEVKALEIIWKRFPDRWGPHNTIHVDDLARNFAFNPRNGVKVSSFRKSRGQNDTELLTLGSYLTWLSTLADISAVDHVNWKKRVEKGRLLPGKV